MKKFILSFFLFSAISLATQGQETIGTGLAYGSEIENLGMGINAEFDLNEQIDISPSFIFYFKNNNTSMWELNGNINYIFNDSGPTFYGIVGLNITGVKFEGGGAFEDRSDSELGFNLGIGASFAQTGSVIPFAEAKYVLSDFDQLSLFGGVRFPLN